MVSLQKVRKTEEMPPENFEKHMLQRHSQGGELATLTAIDGIYRTDRPAWEKYHAYLHKSKEYQHEH